MRCIHTIIGLIALLGGVLPLPHLHAQGLEHNLTVVQPEVDVSVLEQIEQQLAQILMLRGVGDDFEVKLLGRKEDMASTLHQGGVDVLETTLVEMNERGRYLSALVHYAAFDEKEKTLQVRARYTEVEELPVMVSKLRQGDIINPDDIIWKKIARSKIKRDTVRDEASIIGKSPRRTLMPGKPIRAQMILSPIVVHKKDRVWMVYQTPMVKVMATGVAMEDGGKDAFIRVKNIASGTIVHAIVTDENYVKIPVLGEKFMSYKVAVNDE